MSTRCRGRFSSAAGQSLVELMIVISMSIVLFAATIDITTGVIKSQSEGQLRSTMMVIQTHLQTYYDRHDRFPARLDDLYFGTTRVAQVHGIDEFLRYYTYDNRANYCELSCESLSGNKRIYVVPAAQF
jgi:type II secretory pathway pseudopilin PulG